MYANNLIRYKESIKLTNVTLRIITMETQATMKLIVEVAINLVVNKLKSIMINPSLMEEV